MAVLAPLVTAVVLVAAVFLAAYNSLVLSTAASAISSDPSNLFSKLWSTGAVYRCTSCCEALEATLSRDAHQSDTEDYYARLKSYFSAQAQSLGPRCVVMPRSAKDVSTAVFTLMLGNKKWPGDCKFAVRSGGHGISATLSNIHNGIVLDLGALKDLDVNEKDSVVHVGPGNTWAGVYEKLDQLGLSTSGGRVSTVGVGGLTTGGGLSFFSPRYGFVSDNVVNFEVVLSSGKIANANVESEPALWRALKGGSNNFGVVTRITLRTFRQGPLWGGFLMHPADLHKTMHKAVENFTHSANYDPFASLIHTALWASGHGNFLYTQPVYTRGKPYSQPTDYPSVFAPFTKAQPIYHNTLRVANLTEIVAEVQEYSPVGRRQRYATRTIANSAEAMTRVYELFESHVKEITTYDKERPYVNFALIYQPIPTILAEKGGDTLGLDSKENGDMINVLMAAEWQDPEDDKEVERISRTLFGSGGRPGKIEELATQLGVNRRFLYLNYAAAWQDPLRGYGEEVLQDMWKASRMYDPIQMFQEQVPGGFKLPLGESPHPLITVENIPAPTSKV